MARSASRQDAANSVFWLATSAGTMEWYPPLGNPRFVPAIKFRPSGWGRDFFHKIFSVTVKKIFFDFSDGMELENEKTESINETESKKNNDNEFQEYILEQKPANNKVKTQSDMKAWNVK